MLLTKSERKKRKLNNYPFYSTQKSTKINKIKVFKGDSLTLSVYRGLPCGGRHFCQPANQNRLHNVIIDLINRRVFIGQSRLMNIHEGS